MIWRRFIVRADTTIAELHFIVQLIMGWSDTHLNCFKIYGKEYGVTYIGGLMFSDHPMKVCLKDLRPYINWKFTYEYDFNDNWQQRKACWGKNSSCLPRAANTTGISCPFQMRLLR